MNDSKVAKGQPKSVAKAALLFGSGTLSSRILGLIRDMILVATLSIDTKDAWLAAYRLPNFFRRILGEGGLSASFIPIFVENHQKSDPKEVRELIDGVFTLLFTVSASICVVAIIYMPELVGWWLGGKGFADIPGKIDLTIGFARVMFGFLLCMSLFAFFMAILNGVKKFALTGFAPVLFNISIISALVIFGGSKTPGFYVASAVLVGGILQFTLLIPSVIRLGLFPRFKLTNIFNKKVNKVLNRFVPTLFGLGVVQLMGVVNLYFASQLESGSVTYIYMADRLLELPLSLIGVSIGTALLPTLSEHWSNGQGDVFSATIFKNLQLFLFLAIPSAVGLWFMGDAIVAVLFVRGEFSIHEIVPVAEILKAYSLLLLCAGCLRIFNQAFYASQDTLTPALIATFGLIVHILMAPQLMALWGVFGLCLSTALTSLINVKVASFFIYKRFGFANFKAYFVNSCKFYFSAAVMGEFLYFAHDFLVTAAIGSLGKAALLFVVVGVAAVLYFFVTYLLKVEETTFFIQGLVRRLRRTH